MKRLSVLALALVLAAGCGSSNPTSASGSNLVKFTAALSPANEVPPITNADAGASGAMTLNMNLTKDSAGTITAATGDFTMDLKGFPSGTTLTGAHIHKAPAGTNAGVLVNLALGAGEIVLVNGAQVVSKNAIAITAADAQDIINNPSQYYFNVHTTINTGGAIRNQLVKQ
jgi:hypothetical protein